jgi:pimeloyl-ACP methyl ester carboxylesterase
LAARKVYSRDVRGRIGKERFVPASERMVVINGAESCVKVQGGADDPTVLPVGSSMLSCATSNIAFADHGPRWRERLGEITAPTLVLHGEDDRFFPIGNGEALAAEIPNAPGPGRHSRRGRPARAYSGLIWRPSNYAWSIR